MTRGYIRYRSEYKYQIASEYRIKITIQPTEDIVTDFICEHRLFSTDNIFSLMRRSTQLPRLSPYSFRCYLTPLARLSPGRRRS